MSDFGLIITIVLTGMGIVIAMGGIVITLFLWMRSEANADRRDIVNLIVAIKEDIQAIQHEVKDFHARMCVIEERRK